MEVVLTFFGFMQTYGFELFGIFCFTFAWPLKIYKAWQARSNRGVNVWFAVIVLCGYFSLLTNKLLNNPNWVVFQYCLAIVLVSTDILVYFRNDKLNKDFFNVLQIFVADLDEWRIKN